MGGKNSHAIQKLSRDRIYIVTGANSGTGYEIAKWCAMMGATVIMACRSEDRARAAMAKMNEEFKALKATGKYDLADYDTLALEFMRLDLGSFASVIKFCEDFKKSGRPLHVFFGNAGFGLMPYKKTEDGFEETLQVNYLSHFVMIAKLLPIIRRSGPDCRILLMSSHGHNYAKYDRETTHYTGAADKFPGFNYYCRSKLYQVMQIATMARRLNGSNVTCFSVHPGWVASGFGEAANSKIVDCLAVFGKITRLRISPRDATQCSIDLCTNPKYEGDSGKYWAHGPATASSEARNEAKQEQLWTQTMEYLKTYLNQEEIDGMEGKTSIKM